MIQNRQGRWGGVVGAGFACLLLLSSLATAQDVNIADRENRNVEVFDQTWVTATGADTVTSDWFAMWPYQWHNTALLVDLTAGSAKWVGNIDTFHVRFEGYIDSTDSHVKPASTVTPLYEFGDSVPELLFTFDMTDTSTTGTSVYRWKSLHGSGDPDMPLLDWARFVLEVPAAIDSARIRLLFKSQP